jgi:hypothetical protein
VGRLQHPILSPLQHTLLSATIGEYHNPEAAFIAVRSYLQHEWECKYKLSEPKVLFDEFTMPGIRMVSCLPQQSNHYDCGLFVLAFMEFFIAANPEFVEVAASGKAIGVHLQEDAADKNTFMTKKWFSAKNTRRLRNHLRALFCGLLAGAEAAAAKAAAKAAAAVAAEVAAEKTAAAELRVAAVMVGRGEVVKTAAATKALAEKRLAAKWEAAEAATTARRAAVEVAERSAKVAKWAAANKYKCDLARRIEQEYQNSEKYLHPAEFRAAQG